MSNLHLQTIHEKNSSVGSRKKEFTDSSEDHPIERRDKLEIILAILEIAQQPTKKTHILYTAKINFYQLSKYLGFLVAANMIERISTPVEGYRITEKGRLLLTMFNQR